MFTMQRYLSPGRSLGLLALASGFLGLPLALPQPQGPTVAECLPFQTIDEGSYSGFGGHCWDAWTARDAAALHELPRLAGRPVGNGPCYAGVARPAFEAVIRNECAWLDLWTEHTFDDGSLPPWIDFERFVVLAVIKGPGSGCSGIEISAITEDGSGARRVHVRQERPCYRIDCLALSNPYHFVMVPVEFLPYEAPIAFVHDDHSPDCITKKVRRF
jgi:hypothetical protein